MIGDIELARRLKRWTTINTVYTLVILLPGIIALAALAASGYWQAIPALFVLFAPKAYISARWDDVFEEITGQRSPLR